MFYIGKFLNVTVATLSDPSSPDRHFVCFQKINHFRRIISYRSTFLRFQSAGRVERFIADCCAAQQTSPD